MITKARSCPCCGHQKIIDNEVRKAAEIKIRKTIKALKKTYPDYSWGQEIQDNYSRCVEFIADEMRYPPVVMIGMLGKQFYPII